MTTLTINKLRVYCEDDLRRSTRLAWRWCVVDLEGRVVEDPFSITNEGGAQYKTKKLATEALNHLKKGEQQ